MIELSEALEIIKKKARSFGEEDINLEDADNRILAEDVLADRDYPPFNRSAMDGYAIISTDWQKNIREFRVVETIFAGNLPKNQLKTGECYKIMTGAATPAPADAIIRREDTAEENSLVTFNTDTIKQFQNIAKQGEDLKKHSIAIPAGSYCNAAIISTLATLGKTSVKVKKLPRVSILTTGNEVKPVYAAVSATQIRNSNEWLIKSLLKRWQISPAHKHLADNKEELYRNIQQSLDSDILILSGGVSAGDADFIPEALAQAGVLKLFHKVQIRPGKPFWCGETPGGCMVFALPGNPFSTLVTFRLFVDSFLENCIGQNPSKKFTLPFNGKRSLKTTFDEFFPVKIEGHPSTAHHTAINGSGDIRLGSDANAIAHHPKKNPELLPGTFIECFLF